MVTIRYIIAMVVIWLSLALINNVEPIFPNSTNAFKLHTAERTSTLKIYEDKEYPNKMLITGVIEYDDTEAIIRKLNLGNYDTIVLNSPGGNLSAGMILGREFRKRDIKTVIPSGAMCASTCAYAFMGGTKRVIKLGGGYGLHRPYLTLSNEIKNANPLDLWNDGVVTAIMVSMYLMEMGMDSELAVLHLIDIDMRFYKGSELKKHNIVT